MLLSVDGGATKTLAIVMDENTLKLKGIGLSGSSNLTPKRFGSSIRNINLAVSRALRESDQNIDSIDNGIFGIAGIGDSKEMTQRGEESIKEKFGRDDFQVMNDGGPAYYLANIEEDGIVFAGGTGSVIFIRKRGKMKRLGGWNWFVGDDGSASWIARRALNLALMQYDGLFPGRELVREIEKHFRNEFREAIAYIDRTQDKREIASFAPIVSKLASEGYQLPNKVLDESAEYVSMVLNKLKETFNSPFRISILGGTMLAGRNYVERIRNKVSHPINVYFGFHVAIGGLIILSKLRGEKIDFNMRDNLVKQLNEKILNKGPQVLKEYLNISNPLTIENLNF